jgi:Tfp pilus assembly protein PilW
MTTTSTNTSFSRAGRDASAGFTLAEVLISAGIAGFILTAVLTSFLMIGRSGANMANYVGMEEEARRGLEKFGEDTRMSSGIITDTTWPNKVTLYIPDTSTSSAQTSPKTAVQYYWDTRTGSATYHCFIRQDSTTTQTLIHNVNTFAFDRYVQGGTIPATTALSDLTTSQLQIHMVLKISAGTANATNASNLVVSARYILRNKPVSANYTTP